MQPVKFLKFLRQLGVLIQRNLQLIWNDKLLLASLALQSPFMVLVVKLTAVHSGRYGDVYGHAELLPRNL